jgi:Tfp pilus assembly protein PilE
MDLDADTASRRDAAAPRQLDEQQRPCAPGLRVAGAWTAARSVRCSATSTRRRNAGGCSRWAEPATAMTARRSRGVTLIDLSMAVAVAGVLASVALPSYQAQLARSQRMEAITALTRVQAVQEQFRAHHGTPSSCAPSGPPATSPRRARWPTAPRPATAPAARSRSACMMGWPATDRRRARAPGSCRAPAPPPASAASR